ncbi:MAG: AI-2E family transporter [Chloroflexota bacterium]
MSSVIERSVWFRMAVVVAALAGLIFIANTLGRIWDFLGDLILVIFFGWLVGSLLLHAVNALMRIPRMPRPVAITLVYLALITLIADIGLLVVPETTRQVNQAAASVQEWVKDWDAEIMPGLARRVEGFAAGRGFSINLNESDFELAAIGTRIGELAGNVTGSTGDEGFQLGGILLKGFGALFNTGMVIVLSFYVVLDGGRRLNEALKVLPSRGEREVRFVLRTIDDTFSGYVRGIMVVMLIYAIATASVMMATGLPAALPVALVSALLMLVPFVGDWLSLALPLLVAAINGEFLPFVVVLLVLLFVQQVMLNLATPRILGRAVRMPAMIVFISVILGARLAGVAGALLGVPTAAVLYNLAVEYGLRIRQRREVLEEAALAGQQAPEEEVPTWQPSEPEQKASGQRTWVTGRNTTPGSQAS